MEQPPRVTPSSAKPLRRKKCGAEQSKAATKEIGEASEQHELVPGAGWRADTYHDANFSSRGVQSFVYLVRDL